MIANPIKLREQINTLQSRAMKTEHTIQAKNLQLAKLICPFKAGDQIVRRDTGDVYTVSYIDAEPFAVGKYRIHGAKLLKSGKPSKKIRWLPDYLPNMWAVAPKAKPKAKAKAKPKLSKKEQATVRKAKAAPKKKVAPKKAVTKKMSKPMRIRPAGRTTAEILASA